LRRFKTTDLQVVEIINRYNAGERAFDLGAEFGIHEKTVLVYVKLNPKPDVNTLMRSVNTGRKTHLKTIRFRDNGSYDAGEQKHRQEMWHELQQGGWDYGNTKEW
jgi:hypothetical protein